MKEIRMAAPADSAAIAEIYGHYVSKTSISFETEPPSAEEMRKRMEQVLQAFPWLVWEEAGSVLGYAYASAWKNRCAYDWSVETTVYLKFGQQGRGIGRALYKELLNRIQAQGVVNVIGGIALPNAASVALHEALGFKPVGVFRDVGYKFGSWHDVGYWQLQFSKPKEPKCLGKPRMD